MTAVQDLLEAAQHLSPIEQLEIIQGLSRALQQQYTHSNTEMLASVPPAKQRIPSLDAGSVAAQEAKLQTKG